MELAWSEPAEASLDAIVMYIAADNIDAALELDNLLRKAARGLTKLPRKGKPGRVPGTRELLAHPNYVLVYLLTEEHIQIVNVLHSSRQWPPE